jgi:hypothetical protein
MLQRLFSDAWVITVTYPVTVLLIKARIRIENWVYLLRLQPKQVKIT